ncbi:putative glyceraldehyde 3-phosphate dehydrogenase [Actinoplanes missouriensis 431]|uniref:Glyceraldehyde-3-phosphate dehydrogenase n=1 Tax=Actinoplanes missouriensis (strain ATCC 14538 / DSM 43046 / CBS 188.64 / JCM 3121 / NBRC 102363 / NCIMB 12654 / NRRL B-3342 / UNCC 431) TaxID=512565 RepID=I0HCI4_ACTM4|nr:type I glyceraldehyde-3-phosphate dehydrogenase [Actinoplanes missouriensis]BAL90721.1 putative glyceraldehyde 3-phosphate dehydrogenase [Actinoplanes missouriensis 431]
MTRVAINGFGRIGRNVLRAAGDLEIVAVNDLADTRTLAHLLRYDSTLGRYPGTVEAHDDHLIVDGRRIDVLSERDPARLPWKDLGVDVAVESTGRFTAAADARAHLTAGARKVLVSAPSKGADITIAYGLNHGDYDPAVHDVVSNASCTTNGLAPVAAVLDDLAGIETGSMTTIHAYTQEQNLQDAPHRDLRRARAAALNIAPTTTGAATAIGAVLPRLAGRLTGYSVRVPVPVGSLVELNALVERPVTTEEINSAFEAAAAGPLRGILEFSADPLVSTDITGNPASSIFDSLLTAAQGRLVKAVAWYDNEWGFANRVVDTLRLLGRG